jgi:tripeptidyl-peptidase II
LNKKLALVCDADWIEHPAHLYLVNSSRQVHVRVHADKLEEGGAYFTTIKAYDIEDPARACLFKIPITVIKPLTYDSTLFI